MTTGAGTHSSALTADRSPLSDSALVAAARKGDMKAFERLYRLHSGKVMGLCLRMTRRRDVAEDCVQQTFIRAWRSLAAFEGRSAFGTWLHRIAVNEVLTHQRNHGTRAESDDDAVADALDDRAGRIAPAIRRRRSDGRGARARDACRRARVTSSCCRRYTATATKRLRTCSASRSARAKRSCIAAAACCASVWVCRGGGGR